MTLRLSELGPLVQKKRGVKGVRAAAEEVGISHATLSRIENGQMPDLETFAKVCGWLDVDPGEFLGMQPVKHEISTAAVHFRKGKTVKPKTAQSLANLILAAQSALRARSSLGG